MTLIIEEQTMTHQPISSHRQQATELDTQDPLAHFRQQFIHDHSDRIYLDGNSLGRLPARTPALMEELVQQQWGQQLISGWNNGWMALPHTIGGKIGQLIGAAPDEITIADSTSINLFKLALAALQSQPTRHTILTDDLNFPSDLYILQGIAELAQRPLTIHVIPSPDGIHGPVADLLAAINSDTALICLSHTTFKSSYTYDMTLINQHAHAAGALTLWDLSHSAGAVPINLHAAQTDLAVGCTYKYLNGGPGAPAFLYIRRPWQATLHNPITGWMGQNHMFDFGLDYEPAPDLRRFHSGTPPILSIAAIEPGIDLLLDAGMDQLRQKSTQQSEYLIHLWQDLLQPVGFRLNSPQETARRGSHISLGHDEGWRINQALIQEMHVIPDFRRPDNIRLGITPLYTSYTDLYEAAHRLHTVVTQRLYEKYDTAVPTVT